MYGDFRPTPITIRGISIWLREIVALVNTNRLDNAACVENPCMVPASRSENIAALWKGPLPHGDTVSLSTRDKLGTGPCIVERYSSSQR